MRSGTGRRLDLFGLVVVLIVTGCSSTRPEPVRPAGNRVPTLRVANSGETLPCSVNRPSSSGPDTRRAPPLALVTLTLDSRTSLSAMNAQDTLVPWGPPQRIGRIQVSADASALAIEHLQGVDARDNWIEVQAVASGQTWRVDAGAGCAVFGFALDPPGKRLAYSQVAMRGPLKPAAWQITTQDLTGTNPPLTLLGGSDIALVPVAWSQRDVLWLQALAPFQTAGAQGLWRAAPDGSGLEQVLPESDYVGEARVSPDGRWLAYLASDTNTLPPLALEGIGAPPANQLVGQDLLTHERRILAKTDAAFSGLEWTKSDVLFGRGEWIENRFRNQAIDAVSVEAQSQVLMQVSPGSPLRSWKACGDGSILYSLERTGGDELHWWRDGATHQVASPVGAEIRVVTCSGENTR